MPASYASAAPACQLSAQARSCRACPRLVPGSAILAPPPPNPLVLFIGEAPGRLGAARTGIPFCGDMAGRRFDLLLAEAGLDRHTVAVTNAVLCLPLDARGRNRRPAPAEVRTCTSFLAAYLQLTNPPIVAPLGAVALAALGHLHSHGLTLRQHAGTPHRWAGRCLVPLTHPAARAAIHRPFEQQLADWRSLGQLARSLAGRP